MSRLVTQTEKQSAALIWESTTMTWKMPEGGPHHVAIRDEVYKARRDEVDNFFGRPLWRDSHQYRYQNVSYEVFAFKEESEALAFMKAFEGEPFDPRDKGGGKKWMMWFKGRVSGRKKNPYIFD